MGQSFFSSSVEDIWHYETFCGTYLCIGMRLCCSRRAWTCWCPCSWLCCCPCCCRSCSCSNCLWSRALLRWPSCCPCTSSLCCTTCTCTLHNCSPRTWSHHRPPTCPSYHQASAPWTDQLYFWICHQDPQASNPSSSHRCPNCPQGNPHCQRPHCQDPNRNPQCPGPRLC